MNLSSLPEIDSFLQGFADERWLERGINKSAEVSRERRLFRAY